MCPDPTQATAPPPTLSLLVPAYNEIGNILPLYKKIRQALQSLAAWELILVDDGSSDGTGQRIAELSRQDPRVRGIYLAENRGQTSALAAGLAAVQAPLVATLDADLQNDPEDLLRLLAELGDNDAVVGYRRERHDSWLRRISSNIANGVRNKLTGDDIRDTGCSLKLFRRAALRRVPLFEGMHRFLPTLLRLHGYRVVQIPVSHAPRTWGESKYGVGNRLWKSLHDLFAVRWMRSRILHLPLLSEPPEAPEKTEDAVAEEKLLSARSTS